MAGARDTLAALLFHAASWVSRNQPPLSFSSPLPGRPVWPARAQPLLVICSCRTREGFGGGRDHDASLHCQKWCIVWVWRKSLGAISCSTAHNETPVECAKQRGRGTRTSWKSPGPTTSSRTRHLHHSANQGAQRSHPSIREAQFLSRKDTTRRPGSRVGWRLWPCCA
ncbi:hypothetical protein GQ53DRAFT_329022 [Thozetella sp. PMI_491]|nr:hypothetical protein GQ53DRAFT_329022 [Thozetella sp. PMI_491]